MKGFQKLALAAAIAAAPFAAQAELTAMDDALLSEMTGQAGVTIDLNLDVEIAEIRYTDEDGSGTDIGDGGFLTLSNIVVNGDQGVNSDQAVIKGVTIDVDGSDGIVIGLGQIGGQSTASAASSQLAVANTDYWTGVNISADLGINGTSAGSVAIKNFTNYVPNALAVEAVNKFGYDIVDTTGNVTGTAGMTLNFASAAQTYAASSAATTLATDTVAQYYADNSIDPLAPTAQQASDAGDAATLAVGNATLAAGAAAQGTKVILANNTDLSVGKIATLKSTITSEFQSIYAAEAANGDTDEEIWETATTNVITADATFADALAAGSYVDASISIKAGGSVGEGLTISAVAGFVIEELTYDDDGAKMGLHNFVMFDTDTDGTITGFKIDNLTIDVVASGAGWTPTNSSATAALKIAGLNTSGTIGIGDIFIGDHETGSLGGVSIRGINMSNTEMYIYGH